MTLVDAAGNVVDRYTLQGPPLSAGHGTLAVAPGASVYFLADLHSGCFEHKVPGGPFRLMIALPDHGPAVADPAWAGRFTSTMSCHAQPVNEGVLTLTPPPGPNAP